MALDQVTRQQLNRALNAEYAVVRAIEALLKGVQFAPEQIEQALATAEEAAVAASAAQTTANAASAAATAAQANIDAVEQVAFVTIGTSPDLPNERSLVVGLGLTLSDGGPGGAATLNRSDVIVVLGADVADTTGAFVNATGLTLPLVANATYMVEALLSFQSAATTTGLALGFTLPAGATMSGMYQHNTTATALEGSYNIASGVVKGNTSGVLVAIENVPLQGRWLIKTDATAGNAQLQFRTEVAASAVTLKAGLSALVARRLS